MSPEAGASPEGETYLVPGTLYAASAPCVITTLVGSCVAVTLWSPAMSAGGMNHYLMPRPPRAEGSPRYGETALSMLLARLEVLGARPRELEVRIFGGATLTAMRPTNPTLGEQNVDVARAFARRHQLRVLDEDVGGKVARRICLDVSTGAVRVIRVGAAVE